jgi:hypothetical protein
MKTRPEDLLYRLTACLLHWQQGEDARQEAVSKFQALFRPLNFNKKVAFMRAIQTEHAPFLEQGFRKVYTPENLRQIVPSYDYWREAAREGHSQLQLAA